MNFTAVFHDSIRDKHQIDEAIAIIKANSNGKIWLIGGFVYRNIASQLYGFLKPRCDFDFIVEEPAAKIELPGGWSLKVNAFGNPKFFKDSTELDFVPLKSARPIIIRSLAPTIENFLKYTPLNIQSIAYDVINKKIIGGIGMDAITARTIAVNDLESAEFYVKHTEKGGGDLVKYIKKVADSLEFKAILP